MSEEVRLSKMMYATKREQGGYSVTYYNGADMGAFEYDVDGYLYYWPVKKEGFWAAHVLRELANLLDHLNAPWDEEIKMAFDKMESKDSERLAEENKKWPSKLKDVPEDQWGSFRPDFIKKVMRSKTFLVQIYMVNGVTRLTINRTEVSGDRWKDEITWDELQELKNQAGFGEQCAVEIYPQDRNLVNEANMRHLWIHEPDFIWKPK